MISRMLWKRDKGYFRRRYGWVCESGSWLPGIFPDLNEKKIPGMKKKIPDNSDTIGCSEVAINISNRLRILPENLPDIHPPNQLPGSSEIGQFEDQCSASEVKLGPPSRSMHPGGPGSPPISRLRSFNFEWTVLRAPWELDEAV